MLLYIIVEFGMVFNSKTN